MHIVFVDFRKAFNLVDHAILLTKLAASGVNRGFWKWTQSFLTGRTLQVKLPGALSKVGQVIEYLKGELYLRFSSMFISMTLTKISQVVLASNHANLLKI